MASQTTYYNLIKPATSDTAAIADINSNSDTIDTTLNTLNSQIANIEASIYLSSISVASTGSHSYSVTGITADWVVVDWGWSTGNDNDPPVDVTVTTGAGTVTVNVTAVHTANATISPTFIKRVQKTYSNS